MPSASDPHLYLFLILQEQQQNITAVEARAADLESQLAKAQQAAAADRADGKAAAAAAKQASRGSRRRDG